MGYKVTIYCPDQHIIYNLNTLNKIGVGGGITARVRIAHALADEGHDVTAFINCPKEQLLEGVRYRFFSSIRDLSTDVFIASTSGGNLNLSSISGININARIRILMVHGNEPPNGINFDEFDFVYCLSNYVRDLFVDEWNVDRKKIFVTHRGVKEDFYTKKATDKVKRDPFSIIYTAHPSKGLQAAKNVLTRLREKDPRFNLQVYGGYELWGQPKQRFAPEEGISYHDLIGQQALVKKYHECGFNLNLQTRQEPFGMVILEAMRSGCIVIASPVGAFSELIQHGRNGFLMAGDPESNTVAQKAASLILEMVDNPGYSAYIKGNARSSPLTWKQVAETWRQHWDIHTHKTQSVHRYHDFGKCNLCKADLTPFPDGLHCLECGYYRVD